MTDKDKIKFAIRYLKKGLKSKRTPPLYEELMKELGFEKKVNNHSGVAVDFFKENYPEYVTEKGECLSPYWDLFSAGVICATFELNNEIAELKAYNEKLLNGDIEKHNKIVELEVQIEELKRERETINPCGDWNNDVHMCQMYVTHDEIQDYCHEIEEAKSIIRDFLDCYLNGLDYSNMEKGKLLVWKATTFLTEEKEK